MSELRKYRALFSLALEFEAETMTKAEEFAAKACEKLNKNPAIEASLHSIEFGLPDYKGADAK